MTGMPHKVTLNYLNCIEDTFRADAEEHVQVGDPMPTLHMRQMLIQKLQSIMDEICIKALPLNILRPTVSVDFGKNEIDIGVDWHLAVYNGH